MEPTTLHTAKTSEPKVTPGTAATSPNEPLPQSAVEPVVEAPKAVEFDRRGKLLPPRQRVGGIITPQ
jgi:hypothetical protein